MAVRYAGPVRPFTSDDYDWLTEFGAAIKTRRQALGWTQRRLARQVGLAQSTLANVEAGRYNTTAITAARLVTALGVELPPCAPSGASRRRARGHGPALSGAEIESLRAMVGDAHRRGLSRARPAGG